MAKDDPENLAARRVQSTLDISRVEARRALHAAKTDDITWGHAADLVLAELAGPGLFEGKEDAQ